MVQSWKQRKSLKRVKKSDKEENNNHSFLTSMFCSWACCCLGGKRKPSFKVVSSLVVQLLHSIKFSMEVPFSNITQQPVEMQKTITTKKVQPTLKIKQFYSVHFIFKTVRNCEKGCILLISIQIVKVLNFQFKFMKISSRYIWLITKRIWR